MSQPSNQSSNQTSSQPLNKTPKTVLITGANAGLGKETARQLGRNPEVEKIFLACRNVDKAAAAKAELVADCGRDVFEILQLDVSNLNSVTQAVAALPMPVEALIMNAGGSGGPTFDQLTKDGVTEMFASNLLGHVALANELIAADKLTGTALYSGSEAARGVKEMGIKAPELKTGSVAEFIDICNGKRFGDSKDVMYQYSYVKYLGALWMAAMARQHAHIRFVTMSPGATVGTQGADSMPVLQRVFMKGMMRLFSFFGRAHKPQQGAARYIQGISSGEFVSGGFYASRKGMSGPIADQQSLFGGLNNRDHQDNSLAAINSFLQ